MKINLPKPIQFEWDKGNETKNWMKHKVTREEIIEAFFDENKIVIDDIPHSTEEKRYIVVGKTKQERILYVSFTIRHKNIRVISTRDLNKKERKFYEKTT